MRIVSLKAENVKRLKAVEINPDGTLVVIGGKNGAGKSSVLDSIMYALAGKGTHCRKPVRAGEEKATIVCELDDLIVKRTITAEGGGTLVVQAKDGARYPSPQTVLDKLTGSLSFDPLEFSRKPAAGQAETLKALVGLDFTEEDATRARVYSTRTTVNRDGRAVAARLESLQPMHEGVAEEESSSVEVLAELDDANEKNAERNRLLREAKEADEAHVEADAEVERAKAALRDAEAEAKRTVALADDAPAEVPIDPIRIRLNSLEDENRKVRENQKRAELETEIETLREKSRGLTERMERIDEGKAEKISSAKYPVEGIGFDEDGLLTLNGVPFEQASSAEQLRVSVAMGLALNPELRVLLVRDGSLLDDTSLAMVAGMAEEADAQVWIERVEDDEHVGVLIEDGRVAGKVTS